MSDIIDRDDVSTWCYDGMCQHCDSDWCDHRCHEPAEVGGVAWVQSLRAFVISLACCLSAIALVDRVVAEWPTLARAAVAVLTTVAAVCLSRWLAAGLWVGGGDHDER